MKLLQITDIHGNENAIYKIKEILTKEKIDLVVVCGDITNFGPKNFAEKFLNSIPIKTIAIPGNCDTYEVVEYLSKSEKGIHGKKVKIGNEIFVGFGGSNSTPFNTPFELQEEFIFSELDKIMQENCILVLHSPPRGHNDFARNLHLGSESIAKICDKYFPKLVLSGHIHEAIGVEKGKSIFVNPGAFSKGNYAIIEIEKEIKVALF